MRDEMTKKVPNSGSKDSYDNGSVDECHSSLQSDPLPSSHSDGIPCVVTFKDNEENHTSNACLSADDTTKNSPAITLVPPSKRCAKNSHLQSFTWKVQRNQKGNIGCHRQTWLLKMRGKRNAELLSKRSVAEITIKTKRSPIDQVVLESTAPITLYEGAPYNAPPESGVPVAVKDPELANWKFIADDSRNVSPRKRVISDKQPSAKASWYLGKRGIFAQIPWYPEKRTSPKASWYLGKRNSLSSAPRPSEKSATWYTGKRDFTEEPWYIAKRASQEASCNPGRSLPKEVRWPTHNLDPPYVKRCSPWYARERSRGPETKKQSKGGPWYLG